MRLQYCLSLWFFQFISLSLSSQEIFISGKVSDTGDKPIAYANVFLESNSGIGTLTDNNGNYKLLIENEQLEIENNNLVFSLLGFQTKKISLANKGEVIVLDIVLEENAQSLEGVVLYSESSASKEYTVLELNKIDIYSNPSANADPLKAIQIYPYSTATDETANPSFRGSNADKSRVLLNGVPVFNPVRNNQINGLGSFSLFNTEIIDKLLVYPSNPPLIYGNSSAGILEIESSKIVSNTHQVSIGLANSGFLISRNLGEDDFIQLYSNRQYSDLFIGINGDNIDFLKDFSSLDIGFNFRANSKNNSNVNVFSYFLNEKSIVESSILNTTELNTVSRNRFFTVINYSKIFENLKLSVNNGYDYSKSPLSYANIDMTSVDESYYTSLNLSFNLNAFFLKSGVSYNFLNRTFKGIYPVFFYAFADQSPTTLIDNFTRTNILESYLYSKLKLGDFTLSNGIRKNIPLNNSINNLKFKDDYLSYQMFVRWDVNKKNNLIFSIGKYHNYSNPNIINQRISLNTSFQTSFDYTFSKKGFGIKASIYSKKEEGLTNNSFDFVNNNIDNRTIYGFEFQFDKNITKKLKFNASYALIDSRFEFQDEGFRSTNDLDYFIKSSVSYFNKGWSVSLSNIFRQGTYFTEVESSTLNPEASAYEPIFSSSFNTGQFKDYWRMDLSINKFFPMKNENSIIAFFSLNNVLSSDNERNIVFNNDYSEINTELFPQRLVYFGVMYTF